jgi:hypothetical protein
MNYIEAKIEMELISAFPEDLKQLKGWFDQNGYKVKKYEPKYGQIYWLRSQITNKFEGPYILGQSTDLQVLKEYLYKNMVFIPRHILETEIKTLEETLQVTS